MQNKSKSIETMKGVFLSCKEGYQNEKKDYNLTILIDDPFNAKINIEIDTDEWNEYINYYINQKWKGILDSPPEEPNSGHCYFNIQEREFYMASAIDDKNCPIWQKSTLVKIVYASYTAMRFLTHIRPDYNRYHAGQRCEFKAYAIDANDNLCKPSSIKKDFDEYRWKFYPTTFKAFEITSESIEHLIAKTPIPKRVLDKIILDRIQEYQHSKTDGRNIDDLVAETPPSESATLEILQQYKSEKEQSQRKANEQKWINKKKSLIKLKDWLIESKTLTGLITGLLTGGGIVYAILKKLIPFF